MKCHKCKGSGWRNVPCGMDAFGRQDFYYGPCPTCSGSGKVSREKSDIVRGEWPESPHRP